MRKIKKVLRSKEALELIYNSSTELVNKLNGYGDATLDIVFPNPFAIINITAFLDEDASLVHIEASSTLTKYALNLKLNRLDLVQNVDNIIEFFIAHYLIENDIYHIPEYTFEVYSDSEPEPKAEQNAE